MSDSPVRDVIQWLLERRRERQTDPEWHAAILRFERRERTPGDDDDIGFGHEEPAHG
jgi:hypothetical protein